MMIQAQTDANRISQYTPFGNLVYGNVDASGNFTPNTKRETSYMTLSPQQQQIQNYSDAAKIGMFGDVFGTYTPATPTPKADNAFAPGSLASTMANTANTAPAATSTAASNDPFQRSFDLTPFNNAGIVRVRGANASTPVNQPAQAATPQAAAASVPLNTSAEAGGIGSFSGGTPMTDPNATSMMNWQDLQGSGLNQFGNTNLKDGVSNFYNLDAIKGSLPDITQDFSGERKRTEDAVFQRMKGMLAPQFEERNRKLQQQLANQGLAIGGEAYGGEMTRLNRAENEGYTNAALDAVNAGGNEFQRMSDLALRTRGQRFGEETNLANLYSGQRGQMFGENQAVFDANNQVRNMQFNERLAALNASMQQRNMAEQQRGRQFNERAALMGIQPMQMPLVNAPQVDAMGAYQNNYAGRLNAYNSQMGGLGSLLGVGGQIAGAMLSDIRLKDNIAKVGEVDGINVYEFSYKGSGERYQGVMAQEVEHIPDAVIFNHDGMRMVDYSKLPVEFKRVA